ncbi:ras-associating and dilute domain-containing protein-like [Arapaima gigas]
MAPNSCAAPVFPQGRGDRAAVRGDAQSRWTQRLRPGRSGIISTLRTRRAGATSADPGAIICQLQMSANHSISTMLHSCSTSRVLPSRNNSSRPARTLTQVLCRTLSQKDQRSVVDPVEADSILDNPAELSTQTSAPGVLRVFGDAVCAGAHYKSVLATPSSSARELVKEALLRYSLGGLPAGDYVLCDVVGELEGPSGRWRPEGLRVLGDDEKPLLLQDLWRPKEGFARRLELRRRAEVEDLIAKEKDTITAGINAQARRLQRNRAKGTPPSSWGPTLSRSQSETSLDIVGSSGGGELKKTYLTLPRPLRCRSKQENGEVRLSLYQCPHLLLLQAYSRQDCLVHLLNRDQHTVGQETASVRPSICLLSPDILPLHCTIRRVQPDRCHGNAPKGALVLEPVADAAILVNFSFADRPTPLRHGDLISFGAHYVFLYKDPMGTEPLPAQTLTNLRTLQAMPEQECRSRKACRTCGGPIWARTPPRPGFKSDSCLGPDLQRRRLHLDFEKDQEDRLVDKIVSLAEPGGDDHRLAPAHLLCLVLDHSGMILEPGSFGKLVCKIAKRIQCAAWEEMKELSEKQAQYQDPASLLLSSIPELALCLQSLLFWMSNTMEVLHFLQQRSPVYLKRVEHLETNDRESLLSAAVLDKEEGVSVLEEVIIYTFQQSVYHITKSLYASLMELLDWNPGQTEGQVPESVHKVLKIFQTTQSLLQHCEVHPEVQSQMFAYLFFFSNVSLFNLLLDKGPSQGWFRTSSGIQYKTNLGILVDWAKGAGLSRPADKFLAKLHSTVSILATPAQQLTQLSWKALCTRYPALKPTQLHYILTQCLLGADVGSVVVWLANAEEEVHSYRKADLLESFEDHPPIVLPITGFQVDLVSDSVDDSIYRQLLYVRHFLWGLRSKSPSAMVKTNGQVCQAHGDQCTNTSFHQPSQMVDATCLPTPPTTPSCPDKEPRVNTYGTAAANTSRTNGLIVSEIEVELDKGPFGLGLGLIDGLQTPLRSPGIYIRTLVPGGPASSDGRLRVGDRILAVNGTDVTGSDYQSAVELIRWGGGKLNLLVEKKDPEVSALIRASLC